MLGDILSRMKAIVLVDHIDVEGGYLMKKFLMMLISGLCMTVILCACGAGLDGKFYDERGSIITLNSDGTLVIANASGSSSKGTYQKNGESTYDFYVGTDADGYSGTMYIEGEDLIVRSGGSEKVYYGDPEKMYVNHDIMMADNVRSALLTAIMDPEVVNNPNFDSNLKTFKNGVEIGTLGDGTPETPITSAFWEVMGGPSGASIPIELKSSGASQIYAQIYPGNKISVWIPNTDSRGSKEGGTAYNIRVE